VFSDTLTAKDTRGSARDLVIALHASDVSARVPPLPSNPFDGIPRGHEAQSFVGSRSALN
jgi:hypothetical protein